MKLYTVFDDLGYNKWETAIVLFSLITQVQSRSLDSADDRRRLFLKFKTRIYFICFLIINQKFLLYLLQKPFVEQYFARVNIYAVQSHKY